MLDKITSPAHYVVNGLECFDVMKVIFGVDAVKTFAKLNAFKYLWRSDRKGGLEDLEKAAQYLKMFMDLEKDEEMNDETRESNRNPGTLAGAGAMGTADHKRDMGGFADGD